MKEYIRKIFALTACVLLGVTVLLQSGATAQGIKQGLAVCTNVLIPSLLPFTVLSAFFVNSRACDFLEKIFLPLTRLFALPEQSAGVLLSSFTGGYPVGCLSAAELVRQGKITKLQARRLLIFCVNSGPSFTVGAVGGAMLSSTKAGVFLFACVTFSALVMGFFSRFFIADNTEENSTEKIQPPPLSQALVKSVARGGESIYSICIWAILFSGIGSTLSSVIKSSVINTVLSLILEVTAGCAAAIETGSLPLTAAVIAFGGISVHCQVISGGEVTGVKYPELLVSRLVHAALSFLTCSLSLKFLPVSITSCVFAPTVSAQAYSVSAPAAGGLMFLLAVLISDLDGKRKVW